MKITYRGDYALKAVLDLAVHNGSLVTINELANHIDAPIKFLEQVLLDLKRGNFVESKRGKVGGYILAREPQEIKLGDVVRFIDGPLEPIGCVDKGYLNCKDTYKCVFRTIWHDVALATSDIVDNITFADLAKRVKREKETLVYQI